MLAGLRKRAFFHNIQDALDRRMTWETELNMY
jgi:hypothetical protein